MTEATSPSGQQPTGDPPTVSFDEFKLYYESTERVTERRLAMNRWNYSISVVVLIAIGGVVGWSASKDAFVLAGTIGVVILCAIAFLLCTYWLRQIDDYKALNNAKFQVLNTMAPKVTFENSAGQAGARSYRPFEREWELMKKGQNLRRAPSSRLRDALVLSSSGAEYYIPRAFRILFLLIAAVAIASAILSWPVITENVSPFGRPSPAQSASPSP